MAESEALIVPFMVADVLDDLQVPYKLDWFRIGGEILERQWRDVLGVMKTQGPTLDYDYLREWAEELEVTDLLEQALNSLSEDGSINDLDNRTTNG